jgi:hypothetical protein
MGLSAVLTRIGGGPPSPPGRALGTTLSVVKLLESSIFGATKMFMGGMKHSMGNRRTWIGRRGFRSCGSGVASEARTCDAVDVDARRPKTLVLAVNAGEARGGVARVARRYKFLRTSELSRHAERLNNKHARLCR